MFSYVVLNDEKVVIQFNRSSVEYSEETKKAGNFITYEGTESPVGRTYIDRVLGPVPEPQDTTDS